MEENMMNNENYEAEEFDTQDEVKTSGSGKLIGLAIAGVAGVAAAGAVVAKKLKAKKAKGEKKPKVKKKLRWVEVPVEEDVVDVESKDIDEKE